jgi:hypothetical protein
MANSTTGAQANRSVTADQPISVGMHPAAPPQTMFDDVALLSTRV